MLFCLLIFLFLFTYPYLFSSTINLYLVEIILTLKYFFSFGLPSMCEIVISCYSNIEIELIVTYLQPTTSFRQVRALSTNNNRAKTIY